MNEIIFTTPDDTDAQLLINKLSQTLESITGDSGNSSYKEKEFSVATDAFLILKINGSAIGCGALRKITATTCEIKRMYSEKKGCGNIILRELEKKAKEFNYNHVLLSTRIINLEAVEFYKKHNYQECIAYGKYKNNNRSVCFEKYLDAQSGA